MARVLLTWNTAEETASTELPGPEQWKTQGQHVNKLKQKQSLLKWIKIFLTIRGQYQALQECTSYIRRMIREIQLEQTLVGT